MKKLVYLCVFFQKQYVELLRLLSLSLFFFGNVKNDTDIVILSCDNFTNDIQNIFRILNINVSVYCINLHSLFSAAYSRLLIFDLPTINNYEKILYLDTDILIMNNINDVLDLEIDNLLYTLEEGKIDDEYHGVEFFDFNKIDGNTTAFTSGILYFNNHINIKNLFLTILNHIDHHTKLNLQIPSCLDQPFIIYHAISNKLYNNQLLKDHVVNNSIELSKHSIHHFMGWPGHHQSKNLKMTTFFTTVLNNLEIEDIINDNIINTKYCWKDNTINVNGYIHFLSNSKLETSFGNGLYKVYKNNIVEAEWIGFKHFLKFDNKYESFVSIRKRDFYVSIGHKVV